MENTILIGNNMYKEELLKVLKNYQVKENNNIIEIINNNGKNMTITIAGEMIVEFDEWHSHYELTDYDDLEIALEEIKNILENKQTIISIYVNNISFATGTTLNKEKYTKEDVTDFLKTFLKHYQIPGNMKVMIKYWDSSKDYELE